jgi:hypothetical protein
MQRKFLAWRNTAYMRTGKIQFRKHILGESPKASAGSAYKNTVPATKTDIGGRTGSLSPVKQTVRNPYCVIKILFTIHS